MSEKLPGMKNYTITVNGNVYDVTVEEGTSVESVAAPVVPTAPKTPVAPKAPTAPAKKSAGTGSIHDVILSWDKKM